MWAYRIFTLIIGVFILSGCTTSLGKDNQSLTDIPVRSSESVVVSPFNEKIEQAVQKGAKWPFSPLRLVLTLLDAETDTRQISIQKRAEHAENPEKVEVIIIRDGFLDDSERGDWHRILLSIRDDGTWRISKMTRSRRCWRPDMDQFKATNCR